MEGTAFKRVGLMLMVMVLLSVMEVQAQSIGCKLKCELQCAFSGKSRSICVSNCVKKCAPSHPKDSRESAVHPRGAKS